MSDEGVAENGNTRGNMGQQDEGSTVTWEGLKVAKGGKRRQEGSTKSKTHKVAKWTPKGKRQAANG
jgi:hypothetical protein